MNPSRTSITDPDRKCLTIPTAAGKATLQRRHFVSKERMSPLSQSARIDKADGDNDSNGPFPSPTCSRVESENEHSNASEEECCSKRSTEAMGITCRLDFPEQSVMLLQRRMSSRLIMRSKLI